MTRAKKNCQCIQRALKHRAISPLATLRMGIALLFDNAVVEHSRWQARRVQHASSCHSRGGSCLHQASILLLACFLVMCSVWPKNKLEVLANVLFASLYCVTLLIKHSMSSLLCSPTCVSAHHNLVCCLLLGKKLKDCTAREHSCSNAYRRC